MLVGQTLPQTEKPERQAMHPGSALPARPGRAARPSHPSACTPPSLGARLAPPLAAPPGVGNALKRHYQHFLLDYEQVCLHQFNMRCKPSLCRGCHLPVGAAELQGGTHRAAPRKPCSVTPTGCQGSGALQDLAPFCLTCCAPHQLCSTSCTPNCCQGPCPSHL